MGNTIYSLFIIFFLVSCEIESNKSLPISAEYPESQTQSLLNEYNDDNYSIEQKQEVKSKFVFAIVKFEQPHLHYSPGIYFYDENLTDINESAYIIWKEVISSSEIMEFPNFNEDDGYKLMDQMKKEVLSRPLALMYELNQVQNLTKRRELIDEGKIKNISSEYFVFDSYKEGTLNRDLILNKNE